jgi:tetratricopeptide (TPR) repeat protein
MQDYTKAIELDPKDSMAYYSRGSAYHRFGNYKQAVQDYTKVIEMNPKDTSAYYRRGIAYAGLGNRKEAIQDYDKVIELDPKHAAVGYVWRGIVYYDLGNYKQAIRDYNKAIELARDKEIGAKAYNNRGIAYEKKGNYKQAIGDYNKAIELDPKLIEAYLCRGGLYDFVLRNYKKAMKDYNSAIELNPKFAAAYYDRGNAYGRHGNRERSIQDLKVAATLGHQGAQNFLENEGIDWPREGVQSAISSDKPPQNPEKNVESSSSATSPDNPPQKPVNNVETSTVADDPYKKIKAIVLKNGKVIEGKILILNPDIVKIRTKDGKVSSYSFKNDVQTLIAE